MGSKTKKLATMLFALAAAVCMALALFFGMAPRTASAEGELTPVDGVLELTEEHLAVDGSDAITGFKDENVTNAIANAKSYSLTIGGSATSIAAEAFKGQTKLTSLTITAGITEIGKEAFYGTTGLTSLTLDSALQTIGESAFAIANSNNNNRLEVVTVPENVTSIGKLAFANRIYLKTINFYATSCGDFATAADINKSISDTAKANPFYMAGAQNSAGVTVNIGDVNGTAVTKVPMGMFIAHASVTSGIANVYFNKVTLSADGFGNYAFYNCIKLKEVSFASGSSAVSIGEFAFSYCSALTTVTLPSNLTTVGKNSFNNCTALTGITIPEGVTTIGDSAFKNCSALSGVGFAENDGNAVPEKLMTISQEAFYQCALASVKLPDSVSFIGPKAFSGCTNLKTVEITDETSKLTTISSDAFNGCSSLTAIIIPHTVQTIGAAAYTGCTAVTSINYYAVSVNDFSANASHPFGNVGSAGEGIAVTIGSVGNPVTKIPANMFYYSASGLNVKSVNFIKVNAQISQNAFNGCTNLGTVTFGAGDEASNITKIGNNAFNGCQMLTDFDMPAGVTEIGDNAFRNCKSILTIKLPVSLTTETGTKIGNNAFAGCERLFVVVDLRTGSTLKPGDSGDGGVALNAVSVLYSDGAGAIITSTNPALGSVGLHFIELDSKYYLIGAITLKGDVVLPDSVPTLETPTGYDIYQFAFQNQNDINSVTIPATVGVVNHHAFNQCKSLTSVTFKEEKNGNQVKGVREIGSNAFAGCTSLTTVNLPSGLTEIESELFQNCTSLTQIAIPEKVNEIGSDAFNNTGLTSVAIPAGVTAINSSAFRDCSSLVSVTFLEKETVGENESKYSLAEIGYGAFQNCTSLLSIVIPETVSNVAGEAFSGDSSLLTVYLPVRATYGTNVFSGCNTNIAIISASQEDYNDYDKAALNNNAALTYIIKVELVNNGDTGNSVQVDKLYGRDYSYELQSDKITWKNSGAKVPVQQGYSKSIWYSDVNYENELTESDITAKLGGTAQVILYARYYAKPEHYSLNTLNYEDFADEALVIDAAYLADINEKLFSNSVSVLDDVHIFSLVDYSPFTGSAQLPNSVRDAGTYKMEIKLDSAYGEWDEPFILTFTVEKSVLDISDTNVLNWVIRTSNGTSQLNSEALWVPVSGEGDPYVAESEEGMPNGYEERYIERSVVRYNGGNWELMIADSTGLKFEVSEYNNRNERNVGIYRAQAVITPTNNYSLLPGSFQYGMSCVPNNTADGSYTVYKVWYIVAMANTLWVPNTSERYHIDGWTYNQENIADVIPSAPALSYGEGSENELVTFTLSLEVDGVNTDIVSAEKPATYNDFSKWINRSMPAGEYTLTINVRAPQGDVADMHETYVFTVAKAKLNVGVAADLVSSVNAKLNGKEFEYAYDGRIQVAYEEIETVITGLSQSALNPNRFVAASNAWSSRGYDGYFGEFSIGYSVSTMTSNAYLSLGELEASQYAPKEAGEYTIYYQLSAPNYEPLAVSVDNKWDYSFSVVIYEQVDANTLLSASYTYTGEVIMPLTSSDRYQVISIEAGETLIDSNLTSLELTVADRNYTDVGTPKIVIKILNPSIYKWQEKNDGSVKVFGENDEYLLVSFTITRCDNYTKSALDIIRWSWGGYNPAVNIPIWTTGFGSEYTYTITSTTNSRTYSQERFGEAPAGEYTLRATAAGGEGYNWNAFTATATINILKADNYWDVVPTVYGWSYGEYATRVSGPAAKPHFGDASAVKTSYYKLNSDGAIEGMKYDSIDRLLEEGELPVGEYLMRVEVAGTSNYNAMPVTDIRFRVSKAYNGWLSVPYVVGWSEGRFDRTENALNKGEVKFGEIIIKVTDSEGKEINVENFDKLSVGNYTVTAYVEGTEDYYEMQPITTTFAVVEDSVSMTGLIAATMVFAVLAVGLAVAAVVLLVLRSRKIEAEFRKMIKKELGRK